MQAVQQSIANLQAAAQAVTAMQRVQAQARAAAATASVPNGLTMGGLLPAAGSATPGSANVWKGANQPAQGISNGRTTVTIKQTASAAILNWQTFNVGAKTTVNFDQSAGGVSANTWVALNRVSDPAAQPSQILGQITAPGQVYILNANGIIFGATAQVNTGALIAATGALSDSQFANFGIYNPSGPTFSGATAPVIVQAGAQITTNPLLSAVESGGFVMLLGSSVQNAGQITTPGGQTILAAGQNFTLRPGFSVNGLVQTPTAPQGVPGGYTTSTTLGTEVAVTGGGNAVNTGLIQATTGDVTMVGSAVTQGGVVVSTTSVAQRGTIHLLTDTTDPTTSVTLAPGSVTYIAPDSSGATASNAQRATAITDSVLANAIQVSLYAVPLLNDQVRLPDQQYESRVEITTGGAVDFQPGSLTVANGGQIAVSAGTPGTANNPATGGRVLVESGAILDVSGLVGVNLPAAANNLAVTIEPFALRDAPVNSGTTLLNNQNVQVDIRQLTEVPASSVYTTNRYYTPGGLLEVSGELGNVAHSIAEWSTLGGTVTLQSPQVVTQPGALFNLAGGTVQYQPGYVAQSYVVASNGQIYNINTAPAGLLYTGVFGGFVETHPRWGVTDTFNSPLIAPKQILESGYTVGRDAGNLVIDANTTVFEATITAGVVNGPFQNVNPAGITNTPFLADPTTAATLDPFLLTQTTVPLGGSLFIGDYNAQGLQGAYTTSALIGGDVVPLAASLGVTTAIPSGRAGTTDIPSSVLNGSGLASLAVAANSTIAIDSAVQLAPGGQVGLLAPTTQIAGTLSSPAGSVTISNIFTRAGGGANPQALTVGSTTPAIVLSTGGTIDTSGTWTNLLLDPTDNRSLAFAGGGSVSLDTTGSLILAAGSLIDASSGGAVLANGATKGASGGNITLIADDPQSSGGGGTAPVTVAGTLRSLGSVAGGSLTLSVPGVVIGDSVPAGLSPAQVALLPGFFQQGFSDYIITGYGNLTGTSGNKLPGVSVAPGTAIAVTEPVYQFTEQSQSVPTGSAPAAALTVALPPLFLDNPVKATATQRQGASIALRSDNTQVGDTIAASAGGSLSMGAGSSITVDPGQKVTLEAYGQVTVDGTITAPGGTISVLNDTVGALPVDASYNYLLGLSIWLGSDSLLNVAGEATTALDRFGRPYGDVQWLSGGSVVIGSSAANADSSLTSSNAFVFIRPGAVVDAAGGTAVIDPAAGLTSQPSGRAAVALGGPRQVAGNGGSIEVSSSEGMYLDGALLAPAGGPSAAGGTLTVALATPLYELQGAKAVPISIPNVLRVPMDIVISQDTQASVLAAGLQPGDPSFAAAPGAVGSVQLSVAQIAAGGFGNLSLFATDSVLFNGDVALNAAQSIQIVSGSIGMTQGSGQVTISAPYVLLRGVDSFLPLAQLNSPGGSFLTQTFTAFNHVFSSLPPCVSGAKDCSGATFTVQADLIDIQDSVRFGANLSIPLSPPASGKPTATVNQAGFNAVNLDSTGDIRFLTNATEAAAPAVVQSVVTSLASPGDVSFTAAQIYPVTGASAVVLAGFDPSFSGSGSGYYAAGAITINGIAGADPAAPLSAFGSLALYAATINQGGIVRAPEGTLVLGGTTNFGRFGMGDIAGQDNSFSTAVNLLPNSITSVSMAGLTIPYGGTADGVSYTYDGGTLNTVGLGTSGSFSAGAGAVESGIVLSGQSVTLSGGAVVDLSGGGVLSGAGFISGRGGSTNTLITPLLNFGTEAPGATVKTTPLSSSPVYAIVAGPQPAYAPTTLYDQTQQGMSTPGESIPAIGQRITIPAGVPGLPAGTYTLLPSYYALLPGGYRVQYTPGSATPQSNATVALTNGSYLTAGTVGVANTGVQSTLPTVFTITSGAKVRAYSQYDEETYSQFVLAQAAQFGASRSLLPIDAKYLELAYPATAGTQPALTVGGSVLTQGADGGYGSWVFVSANQLAITPAGAAPTPDYVSVAAPQINALDAQTLVIGGNGSSLGSTGTPTGLPAAGNSVVMQAGATLSASQVFLTSNQITLEPGSGINTLSSPAVPVGLTQNVIYGLNSPALVAVSNGQLVLAAPGGTGSITIGGCLTGDVCGTDPVVLDSQGTLGLSTQGTLALSTNVQYGARYITLSVADINAGTDAALAAAGAAVPAGLALSSQLLASLVAGNPAAGGPGLLTLSASQSFNFYGDVNLSTIDPATGQSSLQQLTLSTPAIYGFGAAGDVATLTTGALVWNGSYNAGSGTSTPLGPVTANGPGTGSGTLDIVASQIVLGYPAGAPVLSSNVPLARSMLGFSTVNMTGTSQIVAGDLGSLSVYQSQSTTAGVTTPSGGTLNMTTPLLTGTAGAVFGFTAGTAINLQRPAWAAPGTVAAAPLGATVSFSAGSISDSTAIVLPSGSLSMTATATAGTGPAGSGIGDVTLGAGSQIILSGRATQYFDQTSYSWGGTVSLESSHGNVTQDAAGLIDVSAVNNSAGSVNATATAGSVALNGTIDGDASSGFTAGGIGIRTGSMTPADFVALNERLNAGGVFGSRVFDIGSTGAGNPSLVIGNDTSGNAVVQAQTVSVSVDQGNMEVSGLINASGAAPGSITLSAGGGLTLDGTAVLDAHGTVLHVDSTGAPIQAENTGSVTLTAVGGTLTLAPGATINVSAADGSAFGQVNLNAPRTGDSATASATGKGAPANATGTDIAISAAGPLNILGAGSIAVNGFATYANAPSDPGAPAGQPNQFVTQGYLDQINTDSVRFINAALANTSLQSRLAGLVAYGGAFHLRPGVEIDSVPGGNLTVASDLDLSGYRYGPNADTNPKSPTYGAGEPGVLVLRAANNLIVDGSITDGFRPPPATPDDAGWTLTVGTPTAAAIVYEGPANQTLTVGTTGNTTFPSVTTGGASIPDALSYQVSVTGGTLAPGATTPAALPLTLTSAIQVERTGFITTAAIIEPNGGRTFAANTQVPAGTKLPAGTILEGGFKVPTVQTLAPWAINPVTWPANTSLTAFSSATVQLAVNDVIPAGTVYQGSTPFAYRTGQIFAVAQMLPAGSLSWSLNLVGGADLGSADGQTVQAASTLAGGGNVILNDPHSSLSGQVLPSVIRTGTGSLGIAAGGDFTELSLYGVYTAGTQASGVSAADNQPRADAAGANSVLGPAGDSASGPSYNGAIANYQAYYTQGGGNLTLSAQGSVTAFYVAAAGGMPDSNAVGDWLWRQGGNGTPAAWWINFGTYALVNGAIGDTLGFIGFTGIGALGGGNVAVSSGGNVSGGLTIAVASTGRTDVTAGSETLTGGGTVSLTVGGGLNAGSTGNGDANGTLTDLRGNIAVRAGSIGSVTLAYGTNISGDPRPNDGTVAETVQVSGGGPVVVVGDGTAALSALGDLVLDGVGDPTREQQQIASGAPQSWFTLWQPTSAVTLFSAGGNVSPITEVLQSVGSAGNDLATDGRFVYPPILTVTAASGSIYFAGSLGISSLELAPSAQGQVAFLAAQSIYDQGGTYPNPNPNPGGGTGGTITLPAAVDISGADPALLPTPSNPAWAGANGTNVNANADTGPNALFALAPDTPTTALHANDPTAGLFYAAAGDVVGLSTGEEIVFPTVTWSIAAKPVRIIAGRDIVELGIPSGTGNSAPVGVNGLASGALIFNPIATDVSEVIAGRDIVDANVLIAGAGSLYVQAGRNLYQPSFQQSVSLNTPLQNYVLESIGPLVNVNAATRDGGADITVLVGTGTGTGATGPDWTGFASLYLNPANLADPSTPLQDQPGRVVQTYQTQLLAWLQQRFGYTGDAAGALAYFDALPIEQQRVFLLQVYFAELNRSGLDFNNPSSRFYKSYLEGNEAIATLFPGGLPKTDTGDATLLGGSGIRTDFGGTVSLLVPNGSVTLGTAGGVPPPATTGLLTQGSGNIDIYSDGSVLFGQSRVFTTFGGNILIWSAAGDINAGQGAKSTVVFPPEQISYDQTGDITLSPTVPTTGAGIATLAPIAEVPPGDVNLVAPLGVIDAGEAGIRSSGNANLAALGVLNAANIQVQGKATGIPVVAVPNVAAQTAGNAAAGAAQQAAQRMTTAPQQNLVPSIFIVEVIGFGGTDQEAIERERRRHPQH
jgi:filamentous hemagglutinin family protein